MSPVMATSQNWTMTPPARPPCCPPTVETAAFTPIRVCLRHPGYSTDNILLTLPAVDGTGTRLGLHHRTLLTAGAIISGNTFGRAYLSRDRAARERVDTTTPLDGMLAPGDYWLQVRGYEVHVPDQVEDMLGTRRLETDEDSEPSSMPPPPPHPTSPSPPSTQNPQSATSSSAPAVSTGNKTYPVVLSFGDWQFPHNNIPSEWKQRHPAPPMEPQSASDSGSASKVFRRCCVTGYQMGLNGCHLVPKNQGVWWANNGMRLYASSTAGELADEANLALLRADIHTLLDNHHFAIVPKPSPSGLRDSYAFATHVLRDNNESREFRDLYHNVAVAQEGIDKIRPEFLFVRFAWAIFSHLQTFISSPARRHVLVTLRNETGPGSCVTELKLMDGREVSDFLTNRGLTRSGSRKRSSSQMTRDEWDKGAEDVYQERWERHSRQFRGLDTSLPDLDPDMSRIQDNTRWYDEVGQFSGARDLRQEQIQRNSHWYEQELEHIPNHAAAEVPGYDECDDTHLESGREVERGRPLRQAHGSHDADASPPDSDHIPTLSRSFTSHGSNRSSALLDPLTHEDGLNDGVIVHSGSANGDKSRQGGYDGTDSGHTYQDPDGTVASL